MRQKHSLHEEATALEDALGLEGALRKVREQIANAHRMQRRHLYRLHDEIARRHWGPNGPWAGGRTPWDVPERPAKLPRQLPPG
jgi:hypothetical protein